MDEITEEQLVNVKYGFEELFKRADKNQDGIVSTEECAAILESIFGKLPRKRIHKMVNDTDLNKDGNIDYQEFTKMLQKRARKNKFLKAFQLLDCNGDGKISKDEIKSVIKQCGGTLFDEEIEKTIEDVDKDGDGYLNYNEFLNIMINKIATKTVVKRIVLAAAY